MYLSLAFGAKPGVTWDQIWPWAGFPLDIFHRWGTNQPKSAKSAKKVQNQQKIGQNKGGDTIFYGRGQVHFSAYGGGSPRGPPPSAESLGGGFQKPQNNNCLPLFIRNTRV